MQDSEGIPVVPVAAKDPPPEEASSGFAFVRETLHELTGIQSCIAGMKDELKQLRSDLEREQTVRKEETETVRRLLTRNINEESQMRASLDSKLEAFQNLSKTWISSLGKDVMASKERLNSLDSIAEQHSTSLLAHCAATVSDYKSLATSLAELQAEVVRDRATAQASVDTASREMQRNLRTTDGRLDTLQQSLESSSAALNTEISGLSDKVEGLQSVTKTLSKQRDLELLEVRMQKAETSLQATTEELGRKAAASAMKSLSDRVTEMGMEAHTQSTRLQMALDEHTGHIGALEKETQKLERQYEIERSRTSNCIIALEKELATKTNAAESDATNARLSTATAAIQRLETMATTKVSSDTFEKLQGRLDQMEVTLIRKADTETLGKAAQQVTEQARQLESVASHVRDQGSKLEVLEGRSETLKEQILQKAESSNVYTVDGVDGMLRSYYNREEMDALLSRVWWRLGDVAKAPVSTPKPPTR
eukprot:CAMPEP_0181535290 /NCGR_PEP_ID=MMETSP1110-20121109/74180_1 /TAXON_ID=174948 /ORGANISM="Symbiodinium sp., Strain CCMP421" /LENGTH=480 /DNA_ID=CAMNT_0023666667 /DNA_START=66 /DNA_END=1507 /DNA_ORIENTATION=-